MRLLGYTRVSTAGQHAQLQLDALITAGVQRRDVFADVTSGSKSAVDRPGMKKLLDYAEEGDTVVVWRIDRLGRSLIDVLNSVNLLRDQGVKVRSISDSIDPETSAGRMMLGWPWRPQTRSGRLRPLGRAAPGCRTPRPTSARSRRGPTAARRRRHPCRGCALRGRRRASACRCRGATGAPRAKWRAPQPRRARG
jgi:hypothetical protein